ncbi:DNA double-strand break repair nuclease NurA [Lentzea terrae]|uniref:DNA double-strand break repair nuclease NurA n=1 Tax=Lentzea terrae TaxID=2200761 RepID=UPI001E2AC292|nr:DNA double-strand break repair nuclease NurA [Lentzea terrae]
MSPGQTTTTSPMRFSVDGWDVGYGTAMEIEDLTESRSEVHLDVEVPESEWRPIGPTAVTAPDAVLFVDGVRRIDARVWINEIGGEADTAATMGICASYAAGVVCCHADRAHVSEFKVRRGVFSTAPHAADIPTSAGTYQARHTESRPETPLPVALSSELQRRLAEVEVETAVAARDALADHGLQNDLLVIDGPLRDRSHLNRAVGYIKSHRSTYLPAQLNALVANLTPGQRTPVFLLGTSWERRTWYLRLPCEPGAPWAGVVRVEASAGRPLDEVIALANLTQTVLCRFASAEYKDSRAPQNLYPIAGLEKDLRHKLGDQQIMYRALRTAAMRNRLSG